MNSYSPLRGDDRIHTGGCGLFLLGGSSVPLEKLAWLETGTTGDAVLFGDDYGVAFDDCVPTTFTSYIEGVLANYGAVAARQELYGNYRADKDTHTLLATPRDY